MKISSCGFTPGSTLQRTSKPGGQPAAPIPGDRFEVSPPAGDDGVVKGGGSNDGLKRFAKGAAKAGIIVAGVALGGLAAYGLSTIGASIGLASLSLGLLA